MLRGNSSSIRALLLPSARGRRPRAGGIRRKLLVLLVLVLIIVAILPTIVAKTPLRNVILSAVLPSDAVRVSIGGASLSWIRGPAMSRVEVNDSAGNSLLTADSISVDRAPINLALNTADLGVIRIDRPVVYLKLRPDGSNVEDALARLLADVAESSSPLNPETESSSTPPAFAVQLSNGVIFVEDIAAGRLWRIEAVNAQYDCHDTNGTLGNGSLSAQISVSNPGSTQALPAGRLALSLRRSGSRSELALQAEGVALAIARPWLERYAHLTEINGTLSGNGGATWSATGGALATDLNTSGALTIVGFDSTAPQLAGDRIRLARVELPWRITSQANALTIDDLQLKCDVGKIAARGRIDTAVWQAASASNAAFPASGASDVELRGALDVARIAALLPHALGIRSDTTITSGSIELTGRLQPTGAGQSLTGSIRSTNLAANTNGTPLRWDDPIAADFAVRRERGALTLGAVRCESKFLQVQAAGNAQQFSGNASFDLDSLAKQLSQFVDLGRVQLAGTGHAQLDWKRVDNDRFDASASSQLSQLNITFSDGASWTEPQLVLKADATGMLDPISHQPTRIDTAQLEINGQGDELQARLASAVAVSGKNAAWPITIRSTGSIQRWLARARPWFAPGAWKIDGASDITANIRATTTTIDVTETKIAISNLQAASPGWNINEPRVELVGDARVNFVTGELASRAAQLVTSTISIATQNVNFAPGKEGLGQLAGGGAFRADFARLAAWRTATNSAEQYQPAGELIGNVRFAQQSGRITADVSATGQNLTLASTANRSGAPASASAYTPAAATPPTNAKVIWQEPRLTLRSIANYDRAADRAMIEQLQLQSNTIQANIAGQVDRVSSIAECNLNGAISYDLAQVSSLLRPYIGEGIQLNGREQARFTVAGKLNDETGPRAQLAGLSPNPYSSASAIRNPPFATAHWSRRIRAQLELPWGGANVYGLAVGPGELAATLGDGALQIAPIALAAGEGQLNIAPNIRFDPVPSELMMPPGPLVTNVRISPEVSESMLKFMAPVLAGATQSEGQFSLQLDSALRVPLEDTKKADAAGRLTVHSVRVTPGPMTQQWVGLAQQIEAIAKRRDPGALAGRPPVTLLSIRDQQVNFRVVNGRVHHETMEFQVGDVVMRSQGSVGLDETIALTLSVPIQDAWIAKEPLLSGLKGQSLQVPVTGTLKRPQMDQRAIANLTGQLIQNAAAGAVGNELNKALDKIFKPRQ